MGKVDFPEVKLEKSRSYLRLDIDMLLKRVDFIW